jgi:hypothetical protein
MKKLALPLALLAGACSSIGPGTIPRYRFDYAEAISRSWNEQMLLSIVKLRYMDMPMFVEVSSVINQYALSGDVSAGSTWGDSRLWSAGSGARFEDRPTITYSPIVGKDFTRSLMTPVPPGALLFLIQAGWPVDLIFRTCVQAVNGHYNRGAARILGREEPDPEFEELIGVLTAIQASGNVGLSVEGIEQGESALMVIRRSPDTEVLRTALRARELLSLSLETDRFRVTYGSDAEDDTNIAILSRSVFEILIELARQIDVPESDVAKGRTVPSELAPDSPSKLITIHEGPEPPDEAFVSVRYRDRWFWIDDGDLVSKRQFAFVMVLFNLTDTGSSSAVPLLTVGAN